MIKILFSTLLFLILLNSCSIEKRLYRPGFSVSNNQSRIKNNKSELEKVEFSDLTETENINTSGNFVSDEKMQGNIEPINQLNSNTTDQVEDMSFQDDNSEVIQLENNDQIINSEPYECDVIICKNGDEIEAKILEIGIKEIKYKRCDNQEGPTISILNSSVLMIKYPNGTKDIIKSNGDNDDEGPKLNLFALFSLIFGILSLFTVFGGLVFGTLAVIFSEQTFKDLINDGDKYKSNSAKIAKAGKILGIIGLFVSMIIIVVLFL